MKKFVVSLTCMVSLCVVGMNVLSKEQRFNTLAYNLNGERENVANIVVNKFLSKDNKSKLVFEENTDSKIEIDESILKNAKDWENFILLDIKTDNTENPYPEIERLEFDVTRPKMGGILVEELGKDYRLVYIDNISNDATDASSYITDSNKSDVSLSIDKLGTYVLYYNPAIYSVNFYSEEPEYDDNGKLTNPESLYNEVKDLEFDEIINFPEIPEKEGYVFTGWKTYLKKTDGERGRTVFAGPQPVITSAHTEYFATWCKKEDYKALEINLKSNDEI